MTPNILYPVRCRNCDRLVSVPSTRTAFCPHCGRRLRSGPRRGRAVVIIIAASLIVHGATQRHTRSHTPRGMVDASAELAQLDGERSLRSDRIAAFARRADAARADRARLVARASDLQNLSARLRAAAARADDEDRWPIKVAGRQLNRAQADAALARLATAQATERQAIADADRAVRDLETDDAVLTSAVSEIDGLRQRFASGVTADGVADLRRRVGALRAADAQLPDLPAPIPAGPAVDVDSLIN